MEEILRRHMDDGFRPSAYDVSTGWIEEMSGVQWEIADLVLLATRDLMARWSMDSEEVDEVFDFLDEFFFVVRRSSDGERYLSGVHVVDVEGQFPDLRAGRHKAAVKAIRQKSIEWLEVE